MNKFVTLVVLSLVTMSAQAIEKKVSGGVVPTHKPEVKILSLSGTVISDNKKMLTSRYMGYVKNMAVSDGDIVKKGQLLYEIDSKEIESAERQVDLAISQARLALQPLLLYLFHSDPQREHRRHEQNLCVLHQKFLPYVFPIW